VATPGSKPSAGAPRRPSGFSKQRRNRSIADNTSPLVEPIRWQGTGSSQPAVAEANVPVGVINAPAGPGGRAGFPAVAQGTKGRHPGPEPSLRMALRWRRTIRGGPRALGVGITPIHHSQNLWRSKGWGGSPRPTEGAQRNESACSPLGADAGPK